MIDFDVIRERTIAMADVLRATDPGAPAPSSRGLAGHGGPVERVYAELAID